MKHQNLDFHVFIRDRIKNNSSLDFLNTNACFITQEFILTWQVIKIIIDRGKNISSREKKNPFTKSFKTVFFCRHSVKFRI